MYFSIVDRIALNRNNPLFHLSAGEKRGEERIDSLPDLARKKGGNRREVGNEDS